MARYFHNFTSFSSDEFVNESLGSSARSLLPELSEKSYMHTKTGSSEGEHEPQEADVVPGKRYQNDIRDDSKKTKSESDFGFSSKSEGQGSSSTGSSEDVRASKKRRTYRNGRKLSNLFSFNDSDDDFREPKYTCPPAQRNRKTREDNSTSRSCQTVPCSYLSSSNVPSRSDFLFPPLDSDTKLPSSRTKQSNVPSVGASANGDEFGVYGLVDSFFDDLPSSKQCQNMLDRGETSSHNNVCSKQKIAKFKHKPSKECPSSASSSSHSTSVVTENVKAGNINNDAGVALDVLIGLCENPEDNRSTGNAERHCTDMGDTETTASCSGGRIESGAEGGTKQRRFQQKRQISDDNCFNETFDILDSRSEEVGHSAHSQSSSTACFTDGTFTNVLERPKPVLNAKPRTERSTGTRWPSAAHSVMQSHENSCIPGTEVDGMNVDVAEGALRASECRDYQNQTAATSGKLSAAVGSVSGMGARSKSTVTSYPYCRKKSKLSDASSSASSSSSVISDVQHNSISSSSGASSFFDLFEDSNSSNEPIGVNSGYQLDTAIEEHAATGDGVYGRHTSNKSRMMRKRSHTGTDCRVPAGDIRVPAADRLQNAAAAAAATNADGSDAGHLKTKTSHGRTIIYDDDDNEGQTSNRAGNTDRKATHGAVESATSFNDSVVVIGSDDEETALTEYSSQQVADLIRGHQGTSVEPPVSGAEGGYPWRRPRRTARMSCRGD